MISRQNGFGLGVALSLASVSLTFNLPAFGQDSAPVGDETPTGEEAPAADPSAASGTDDATEAAVAEEPAAAEATEPEAPPAEDPEAEVEGAPVTAVSPAREPSSATAAETIVLGVAELPGSAYPSVQVRGITYGSLWRTFHGQQWPYMPQVDDQQTLQIGLSGGFWNDLSNTRINPDAVLSSSKDLNRWNAQSRGVLRVTPTYNSGDGWFAQGNTEMVVQGDMAPPAGGGVIATTDDLWVRFGKWDLFDVTVGRFQGWEIANHYGMALDQNTLERFGARLVGSSAPDPTDGYGLTYFWDRQNFLLGSYAVHVYPTKYLRGELLGHVGAGDSKFASNPNQFDVRPSAVFDVGYLKVKAGWEYGTATSQDATLKGRESKNGFGFAVQGVFAPYVEAGASFARGFRDVVDRDDQVDLGNSNTVQTVGGFLNASPGYEPLVLGFGAFLNHEENLRIDGKVGPHYGKVDTNDQWLVFGAVQYTLWSRLYLKFVVSNASNKGESSKQSTYVNNATSGRLRVEFLF